MNVNVKWATKRVVGHCEWPHVYPLCVTEGHPSIVDGPLLSGCVPPRVLFGVDPKPVPGPKQTGVSVLLTITGAHPAWCYCLPVSKLFYWYLFGSSTREAARLSQGWTIHQHFRG